MRKLSVAILFAVLVSVAVAQIPAATPFTGDLTMKGKGGHDMTGKVYFSGSKMRLDMNAAGHNSIMIIDTVNKVGYMVMPQQKMYMEMGAGQQNPMHRGPKMDTLKAYDPNNPCVANSDMTCQKVGSESVNGRNTDHWIFTTKKDNQKMNVWIDKNIHFPIRTQSDEMQMDVTNIKEGAPAASLFEVPAGYKKFDMGAMMGGRMPQGKDDE